MRSFFVLIAAFVIIRCGSNPVGNSGENSQKRYVINGTTHAVTEPGEKHIVTFEGNRYTYSQFFIGSYSASTNTDTLIGYKPHNYIIDFESGKMAFTAPEPNMPYKLMLFE